MRVSRRRRRYGVLPVLTLLLIAGGSTNIGHQDMAGLLAHQPGVAERARMLVLSGSLKTLKMATFAWPAPASGPLGAAIPEPPPSLPLQINVNRAAKADRLARAVRLIVGPEHATLPGPASEGTVLGRAGMTTDVFEDLEIGMTSLDTGEPTGDPSEFEELAEASGASEDDFEGTVREEQVAIALPGDAIDTGADEADLDAPPTMRPIYHEAAYIFGADAAALPPQRFEYLDAGGTSVAAKGEVTGDDAQPQSPAERLGLDGKRLARAEKCLAEAVYFESRGEPERGQIAVAQVVMNRVFSGYYPSDVCRAVYQNAHRKLACQFTFACDNVRDVVTEPELWKQAERIAGDMLGGKVWDEKVGKATHYHAMSVRPRWIREMRQLDRIGEHTFYRPRRWQS